MIYVAVQHQRSHLSIRQITSDLKFTKTNFWKKRFLKHDKPVLRQQDE